MDAFVDFLCNGSVILDGAFIARLFGLTVILESMSVSIGHIMSVGRRY